MFRVKGEETMTVKIKELSFSYGQQEILKDINFSAEKGESVGLIGANGAGKSTFLRLLVGLEVPAAGSIEICGITAGKKTIAELRRHVGYIFQDADNQLFMPSVRDDVSFGPLNWGCSGQEAEVRTEKALEAAGISHLADRFIYTLSGGEKKLVSIATILALSPDVILMDEPSVTLDPRNRRRLINVLNSLNETKIIASHDLDFILDTCERTVILADSGLIFDGPSSEAMKNRELLESAGLELPLSLSCRKI